jgi:hypothetical protein
MEGLLYAVPVGMGLLCIALIPMMFTVLVTAYRPVPHVQMVYWTPKCI